MVEIQEPKMIDHSLMTRIEYENPSGIKSVCTLGGWLPWVLEPQLK